MSQVQGFVQVFPLHDYRSNSVTRTPHFLLNSRGCNHVFTFKTTHVLNCSSRVFNSELLGYAELPSLPKETASGTCNGIESDVFPHVMTLRGFPKEELLRKVVMVRFDSSALLRKKNDQRPPSASALLTIKYLYSAGAKLFLVSSWTAGPPLESIAEYLSSVLNLNVVPMNHVSECLGSQKEDTQTQNSNILLLENLFQFKEELANCSMFAKKLSFGVDIVVNDAFSQSHKILASTVGVARFCSACIAGFYFEEGIYQLKEIMATNKRPYIAIIGGANLVEKAAALCSLASRCDGLVFVGKMAFQIMHALGLPVPMKLIEDEAVEEALSVIEAAKSRSIPIVLPKDFWCKNDHSSQQLEIFSSHSMPDGWRPAEIGPKSLEEISSFLSRCKKILWIGPLKLLSSIGDFGGTSKLAAVLDNLNQSNCDVTIVGRNAYGAFAGKLSSDSIDNIVYDASTVWQMLKGRELPGVVALDRAHPFEMDWDAIYADPYRPLVVDVGSGNGVFLFKMSRKKKGLNFLGLEINEKLVDRCLHLVYRSGIRNGFFIATDASSTFRSIVSSYPGQLVLVSIQCPNPDFNKPECRRRMLQRSLVEAITDLLIIDGKIFLQSDIKEVTMRMKKEFIKFGKGKLLVMNDLENAAGDEGGWLEENPFGIQSDWERHVLCRGAPMYRLLLSKSVPSG